MTPNLTPDKVAAVVNALIAAKQRHDAIEQVAQTIASGSTWRSPDGAFVLSLSDADRLHLEQFMLAYCTEVRTAITIIEQLLKSDAGQIADAV